MSAVPHADVAGERRAFYEKIDQACVTPLWEVLHALVPPAPRTPCVPHLWRYDALRPWLMESGRLITAKEAVRRVLILENPGYRGNSAVTHSLYAGLQLILPGEVAPSHRHTQSALRFIVEGTGAFTAVDGERVTMHPGDFIITPSWTWHDHGNPGTEPVVWLDGLDIPIVQFFDAQFAENYPTEQQPVGRTEGESFARFGSNLMPLDFRPKSRTSPLFWYPYGRTREALAELARAEAPHAAHGHKMRFVNPATGGWPMPTIGTFIQLLPKRFKGAPYRSTDGACFSVIEGKGRVRVGGAVFEFGPRDHFVVPSWHAYSLEADDEAVLFSFSDRPVQEALDLWREQS
ncbi:MAG: gentisate 1,2-dioxygenase [Burkholderiales bacterium]|jgi:gentisate 1,2-dioxygenase|nr:gentisate 1,2-dioxygenase [Burkholderiales bacterium]